MKQHYRTNMNYSITFSSPLLYAQIKPQFYPKELLSVMWRCVHWYKFTDILDEPTASSTLNTEAASKHIHIIYFPNFLHVTAITCGSWAWCARQADRSPSWQCGTVCSNHVLSENSDCCQLSLRRDSTLAPTWRWTCLAAPNSNGTWSREQVGEKFSWLLTPCTLYIWVSVI
jgi:hypothetical protein